MSTPRTRRPRVVALAAILLSGALLAGCSGGGGDDPGGSGTSGASGSGSGSGSGDGSPSAAPSNYLDVGKKVTLTAQGSDLAIGKAAAVAWALDEKRVAVLDLKVTKVEQVPISRLSAWVLDKKAKASTPFFVHAKVKNIGRSDLSQLSVPLYLAAGDNKLVSASSFESTFKPCPSTPLPKKFKPGKGTATCWVYLAPKGDKMKNVSFFTGPGFDPVTWSGKVVVVKDKSADDKGAKNKKNDKKSKKGNG